MADDGEIPVIPRQMTFELLFLELREPLQALWFECFEALNVDRNDLVEIREKYKKDPKICVIEAIRLWMNANPTWDDLIHVLRYVIMETELADRIEKLKVQRRPLPSCSGITVEDTQRAFGPPGSHYIAFTSLLTEVLDLFNDGSSSYTLLYIISTLCCPNGSPFIDPDLFQSKSTVDGILMPLILHNYISDIDIDFLIHLIELMGALDHLKPVITNYFQHRTLQQPVYKKLHNVRKSFLVRCLLQQNSEVSFKTVTQLKRTLTALFGFESFPYIMQFMGWSNDPYYYFQLPQSCMDDVRKSLENFPADLLNINIINVTLEVGSAHFCYKP